MSEEGTKVMAIDRQILAARTWMGHPVAALLERLRQQARRNQNLAELMALDSNRLRDIGLSERARARIARPH